MLLKVPIYLFPIQNKFVNKKCCFCFATSTIVLEFLLLGRFLGPYGRTDCGTDPLRFGIWLRYSTMWHRYVKLNGNSISFQLKSNNGCKRLLGLPDPRPEIIKKIVGNVHYLHFGCILFVISLVTTVLVSLITEPIDEKYVWNLIVLIIIWWMNQWKRFERSCTVWHFGPVTVPRFDRHWKTTKIMIHHQKRQHP